MCRGCGVEFEGVPIGGIGCKDCFFTECFRVIGTSSMILGFMALGPHLGYK